MKIKEQWKQLLISNAVSLAAGAASALLAAGSMKKYRVMNRPPLAPPGWVFPVVWTILYIFMGTASWLVFRSSSPAKKAALHFYAGQLAVNALWPLIFFRLEAYWMAFFWLLFLWYLVFETAGLFRKISKTAGNLMYAYLAWCTFAAYLNLGAAILN